MRPHSPVYLAATLAASACARSGDVASTNSDGPQHDSSISVSAGAGSSSTGTTSTASTGSEDSAASTVAGSTGTFDLGVAPDFQGPPVGCKGKIDFLFMVSRAGLMEASQEQLALAFPQFIATIESKFADFDYHIMVVDGDPYWGLSYCTENCPTLECKTGDPCCSHGGGDLDKPCCGVEDYPCGSLDLVKACDSVWGAGTVFPAGGYASNKLCPIDASRRYLVKGQPDLAEAFACIATVGVSGADFMGQALTAAMQAPINAIGGCNQGFLRDDALLMVTIISSAYDEKSDSEGTPAEWAQAVVDAKHGDEGSVVMLNIGDPDCGEKNRLCQLTNMFSFHHQESGGVDDYGPAFVTAANLVDAACAEFVPPG